MALRAAALRIGSSFRSAGAAHKPSSREESGLAQMFDFRDSKLFQEDWVKQVSSGYDCSSAFWNSRPAESLPSDF
jgi:hypothetical protein